MNKAPEIFTPNVVRGDGEVRHRLFPRGKSGRAFSITLTGEIFLARVERDRCGLGCECGAFITPCDNRGHELLAQSTRIDTNSHVMPPDNTLNENAMGAGNLSSEQWEGLSPDTRVALINAHNSAEALKAAGWTQSDFVNALRKELETSQYSPQRLNKEARALVKGFGRFIRWSVEVTPKQTRLVAEFVRRYNAHRPLSSQAIERMTMVL